jgi:hypothetical protein
MNIHAGSRECLLDARYLDQRGIGCPSVNMSSTVAAVLAGIQLQPYTKGEMHEKTSFISASDAAHRSSVADHPNDSAAGP